MLYHSFGSRSPVANLCAINKPNPGQGFPPTLQPRVTLPMPLP